MMVSIRMISFAGMMLLTAVVAAGLSMIVSPPPVAEEGTAQLENKEIFYS